MAEIPIEDRDDVRAELDRIFARKPAVDFWIEKPRPVFRWDPIETTFGLGDPADVITDVLATIHEMREQPIEPYTIELPLPVYIVWRYSDRTLFELDGYRIRDGVLVGGWAH